ncbi:uncharacterized protein LOC142334127 isoform X3 [Lycorma delicatula]|uniref:uncharacterized protein LOC142334127 isoform X3 n=1 Tax=Lycorma delicatula TaxID=130591 RepID=UPI003F51A0CA
MIPLKEENDPLSLDSNENCEGLMFIKKEEQGQIKQEESDLADETIDDSVLENIEDNIQNAKYMILDKCKDNVLDNRLHKIFNEIDSASSDGFSNDKSLVFEHDIKINNNDVSDRLVECNKQNINDAKKYTCNHCEKTFKSKYNLKYHNNSYRKKKLPLLQYVKNHFIGEVILTDIFLLISVKKDLNVTLVENLLIIIVICRHLLIHTGKKKVTCNICLQSFNRSSTLKKHLAIHNSDKKHSCNICFKSFNQNGLLKIHLSTHTHEKKYSCNICLKSFGQRCTLNTHLSTHDNEKTFSCSICLKPFSRCDTLKRHLSIHTGEKKFSFNFCQMSFFENYRLKIHLSVHTGQKRFTCDFCDKSFNRKDSFLKHIDFHNEETNCVKLFS